MTSHIPILVPPIVEALFEPFNSGLLNHLEGERLWIVDGTFGGGGHTGAFLHEISKLSPRFHCSVLGVDQDLEAIQRGKVKFEAELRSGRLELFHGNWEELPRVLGNRQVIGVLADLGFSSDQIDTPSRGLSFQGNGPLDMRLDQTRGQSCAEFLLQVSEHELSKILFEYGEERFAKRIAASIVSNRREGNAPKTTQDLVQIVVKALPPFARHGRIHCATRTFQALRIAVNQEMEQLDVLLTKVLPLISCPGRGAIISFHSLEDRKVKQAFKESAYFSPLIKKPLIADEEEVRHNPRARSAKLRIAQRTETPYEQGAL